MYYPERKDFIKFVEEKHEECVKENAIKLLI